MNRNIISKVFAFIVFLFGLYLILRVSGLTRLAITVLGSTGILGLIIGFAFRDIAENFLASILLSMQNPFAKSDLIQVRDVEGYVLSINTRYTLLMTRNGNHVQIPNTIIYKEMITNFSANPNTRFEFTIGIGYDDSISNAQSVALKVLQNHYAVIKDPESLVLVDNLGNATVNLRVIFWIDITHYSQEKVHSAMIRLVKEAFEKEEISMPDEAREILFPKGVAVHMISEEITQDDVVKNRKSEEKVEDAEGELTSNAEEIQVQANQSRKPKVGTDLLEKS